MPLFFHNLSSLIENIESLEMHGNAHYHNETCQMHFGNLGPLLDDVYRYCFSVGKTRILLGSIDDNGAKVRNAEAETCGESIV